MQSGIIHEQPPELSHMSAPELPTLVCPPAKAHTYTAVFLHGRGDNAQNFARSLSHSRDSQNRTLAEAFPGFRWVFPQAPIRKCAASPNTWPQWFDVWDVRDFASREELQAVGLKEMVPEIRRLLAEEASLLGGRWDRLVLAGISMGAATSIHTLFNLDIPGPDGRLGAFLGFSCRCPFAGRSLAEMRQVLALENVPDHNNVLRNTPMLLEHCVNDPLVLVQHGRTLRDTLSSFGATVRWREYPNGGHWFNSPAGIDDAVTFLSYIVNTSFGNSSSAIDLS
ncbi:hypothetical protein QQS21_011408 [Conoideocrella luteorostrata]|uniref:Phospholipase/carboxylesterase/thioesterase domain-containing protein n=1 Tax=Conoideocrella luteorostrata TaxID=1105319 RepID=A0AAJ0FVX1_9HYPO|nr:hypothetical protein QQS21_011408 [Conoideocrella luteorostrata]